MLKMIKEKLATKKVAMVSIVSTGGVLLSSNMASATDGQSTAVVSALTTVAGDITSTFTAIAPIALGIAGAFLVWRYGMKFFKAISK